MADIVIYLLDIICFIFNCILLSVPIVDIYEICLSKDTGKYPYSYLLFGSYCSYAWFIYGIKVNSFALEWSSLYGLIINFTCLVIFICITKIQSYKKNFLNGIFLVSYLLLITLELSLTLNSHFYGLSACIIEVIVALSTVQKIQEAILYEDVRYIPINLVVIFFITNLVWLLYAYMLTDIYIAIPNFVGFICNTYQLYLYNLFLHKKESNVILIQI
jgi:hypothetical protein